MERKKSFEGAKGKRKTGWEMHRECDDEFMQDSREGRNTSSVAGGTSITASKKNWKVNGCGFVRRDF